MNRSKLMHIILIITSALILIGVALMAWILATRDDRHVIHIDLDETKPITFENLCLIPGESCTYTIRLRGDDAEKYDAHLKFEETGDKSLKHFAYIRVESEGQILCDELMAEVFAGEGISLAVDLSQQRKQELIITYYLPLDVGNEAQNAEAFFELLITASNE